MDKLKNTINWFAAYAYFSAVMASDSIRDTLRRNK